MEYTIDDFSQAIDSIDYFSINDINKVKAAWGNNLKDDTKVWEGGFLLTLKNGYWIYIRVYAKYSKEAPDLDIYETQPKLSEVDYSRTIIWDRDPKILNEFVTAAIIEA